MRNITLKNIPDDLYIRLKQAAALHHRSLNSEILYCIEHTLGSRAFEPAEKRAIAQRLRKLTEAHPVTEDELYSMKSEGRA